MVLTGVQRRGVRRAATTERIASFLKEASVKNSTDLEAVRLLLREKAKKDFWFFQRHVYGNVDTDTALHIDMCNRWQVRIQQSFTLWLVPRFHLKTSCFTEAGTLWELVNEPNLRFLISNAKLDNAIDILANIRMCVETNEVFRWLFPEYCPDLASKEVRNRCKWITDRLDFPCSRYAGRREGNIAAMGVEASLVSKHYDRLVFDDPVNDINTSTKDYRDKVERWYRNALQLRHDLSTPIRLIGTRWHFDDLYSRIIKLEMARRARQKAAKEKIKPKYWIYHRQIVEKVDIGGETIAGYDNVRPIWHERFDKDGITSLREENGSYIFSCQFMNNPLPEEDAVFKYSDINFVDEYDIPENVVNFVACDTAVEETEKGDFWVITVASFDSLGRMYVREIIRDKLLTSSFLAHVHALVEKWKPARVGIETVAFQKTMAKVYRQEAQRKGWHIPWAELPRGKSSKFKRVLALQPRVERGDFYVEEGIKNSDWLIEEMTTFPRPAYDDILDTLADLETLFTSASQTMETVKPLDTYDAVYGPLEEDEEVEDMLACSILSVA